MGYVDVFNGDADGICALQQLRLAEPIQSVLVTGVKRDINLLQDVQAGKGDEVTVLDISLDKNRDGLSRLLKKGTRIRYFDHHFAGDIPQHENLIAIIDPSPNICTSLLVDRNLKGKFRSWAVVGAFGDNLDDSACRAAEPLGLDETHLKQLRELGICINYNSYGESVEDLHISPVELFCRLRTCQDPLTFINEDETFERLRSGYISDMSKSSKLRPEMETEKWAFYVLPAEAWARRVSGVFGNQLAQAAPHRAYALLTLLPAGGYMISVRAPFAANRGADELCRQFPTGGGRKVAAGINNLPEELVSEFITKFKETYD